MPRSSAMYRPLASLSELSPTTNEYHCTFVCLIATINSQNKIIRITVFDGSSNPCFADQYPKRTNFLQDWEDIPDDQLLQVGMWGDVYTKFMKELEIVRNTRVDGFNVFPKGIFVEIKCRIKMFKGCIDPVISAKEPLSGIKVLTRTDIMNRGLEDKIRSILQKLPPELLAYYRNRYAFTATLEVVDEIIADAGLDPGLEVGERRHSSLSVSIQAPLGPQRAQHVVDSFQEEEFEFSDQESIPEQSSQMSVHDPSPFQQRISPLSTITEIKVKSPTSPSQLPPVEPEPSSSSSSSLPLECTSVVIDQRPTPHVRELNSLQSFDDRKYHLNAIITYITPIQTLCMKTPLGQLFLSPLRIRFQDCFAPGVVVTDQDVVEVVIQKQDEILEWLGVRELEELYVRGLEIEERTKRVVNGRNQRVVVLKRKRDKIREKLYDISWALVDGITLEFLERQDQDQGHRIN